MVSTASRRINAADSANRDGPRTYYRYPALKTTDWGWQVILYFFLGGLAAGSYAIATLADLFGSKEDHPVARAGRYVALGATALTPILLIADLGRKERFSHMLRLFKSRSPMSMGTWGLGGFGLFVGIGALRQAVEDGLLGRNSLVARLLAWVPYSASGLLGSLFSFFVGSYTGVLLCFTNVPLWAKNRLFLGPIFLNSGLSSGLAAISLVLAARGKVSPKTASWLSQAETAASLGELGLIAGSLATLGPMSRPLNRQPYALPFWLGAVGLGILVPLALRTTGGKSAKEVRSARNIAASLSVLAGGLCLRGVIVLVGHESAKDPSDYLTFTRRERNKL